DATDKTALTNFKHHSGTPAKDYIFEVPSGGVAIFDYDGDGLPDIYLLNGSTLPALQGKEKPPRAALYHNSGNWKFEDVSVKAGVNDPQKYYGFSSAFVQANEDNKLDLIVINDSTPKQLYINKGDGTFEEVGYPSGVALNENGREQAGMGVAIGDYDNSGRISFQVTNFSDDSNVLYHNDGDANFTDVTYLA